jgi:hypothetical protein
MVSRTSLPRVYSAYNVRYHVRACVVAGVGFFTDSYDIFAVGRLDLIRMRHSMDPYTSQVSSQLCWA